MREGIHPNYYQATVTCNCGNTFVTGSTKENIHVEICSKCHPFYTGQQKATQARGRKLLLHAVVSISSTRNTVLNKKYEVMRAEVEISVLFVFRRNI